MALNNSQLIAFVSNSAWSMYNFRLDVLRHLMMQGYRVLVLAPDDEYSQRLQDEGCVFQPIQFDNQTANPLKDIQFYFRLKKLYRQFNPSFIFHYVAKPNIYGSWAAAAAGIPSVAVVTGLGYPFARKNWLYAVVKLLYRKALGKAREVWFLNNEDARIFIDEKIIPIEKARVLPGEGVNTNYFSTTPVLRSSGNRSFTFLMSARLLRSKGIGIYADAARLLLRKNYDVRFELIGFFEKHHPDSIDQEDLQRWQKEGLIHYAGFARDVRPFLNKADCFVFPSFYNEGVPRCLMEAASMELPVITSYNRGCKEVVVNNSTGYFCKSHDPFDLADKMERMIHLSEEERHQMGRNGRMLVQRKFNVGQIITEYINALNVDRRD